jgi:large subunit ribosomal protein L35Ae
MSGKGKKGGDAKGPAKSLPKRRSDGAAVGSGKRSSKSPRLYVKGVMTSFRRSKRNQVSNIVLLKLQGVNDKAEVDFYKGKKVCYIYKGETEKKHTKFRTTWGKIMGAHGSIGGVKAKFETNLPPKALGGNVRVMLYPSRI